MPRLSEFFGIIVSMYFNDHVPPHFHVTYAEHRAKVDIETLEVMSGELPRRVFSLVVEWAVLHRDELRANWEAARLGEPLRRIKPLD
jgi:hypothetical protein